MTDLRKIASFFGGSIIGLILGVVALIVTGLWVILIPIILLVILYYFIKANVKYKYLSIILAYYGTSVIMSIIAILLNYFPNTIGGGLFEAGYILADLITLNSIIDLLWNIQTDSWGTYYDWIIVISFMLIIMVRVLIRLIGKYRF